MRKIIAALLLFFGLASAALAQQVTVPTFPSTCAFNTVLPTLTTGNFGYVQCDSLGRFIFVSPASGGSFPTSATAIQGNASGSTGAVVGTLAAAVGKTTYLCDFDISALGTASSIGPVVIAGLLGGSKTYQMGTLATGTQQLINKNFSPCLPSSAINTAITITTTADATATAVNVNSSGYQQ